MNPRIIWNGNLLDFPELLTRYDPDAQWIGAVNQSLTGKTETTTLRRTDMVRVACEVMSRTQTEHEAFYESLLAWWSWAARGNPWSFAYDAAKTIDTTNTLGTLTATELVGNHNFDTWSSDTNAGSWTEGLDGTGGSITRVEDRALAYSGPYAAAMTKGASGLQTMSQTITLATTTKYRLRARVRNGTAGNQIVLRLANLTTGNFLQANSTWTASTGVGNELTFTPATQGWTTFEIEFTTEGSGTSFNVAVHQYGAEFSNGEILYLDWLSVIQKQNIAVALEHGITVGDLYILREANGFEEEIVVVDGVNGTTIELRDPLLYTYGTGDIFRSTDYYPALEVVDRRRRPFGEGPAFRVDFDVTAREYVT
jgi:hypothetical protein